MVKIAVLDDYRSAADIGVVDEEPASGHRPRRDPPLTASGRLIPPLHIGYVSRQTREIFTCETAEAFTARINDGPVRRRV